MSLPTFIRVWIDSLDQEQVHAVLTASAPEFVNALQAQLAQIHRETPFIHLGTYGEQSAADVPTACGQHCSTWDNPLRYTWEPERVTCPVCREKMKER